MHFISKSDIARGFCTLVFMLTSVAVVASPAAGSGGALKRFDGTFVYKGSSERGAEIIERAIKDVTDEMGLLKDGIAHDRLDDALSVVPRLVIEVHEKKVSVEFQGVTYRSRVGGPWVTETSPEGETVEVRHRMKNGRLIQEVRTKKGMRRNVFILEGTEQMKIDVTVSSPKLPEDITYDLKYRRKP